MNNQMRLFLFSLVTYVASLLISLFLLVGFAMATSKWGAGRLESALLALFVVFFLLFTAGTILVNRRTAHLMPDHVVLTTVLYSGLTLFTLFVIAIVSMIAFNR